MGFFYKSIENITATNCKFGHKLGDALRDRLVCGLKSSLEGAHKKILGTKELMLEKAIEIATSYEAIEKGSKEMQGNSPTNEVTGKLHWKISCKTCYRCGRGGHTPNICRFKVLTCHKCGKVGHIANACKTKTIAG